MEAILSAADPAAKETDDLKIIQARMFATTGNQVGARRLVEEVLAQNASNVEALKMQAAWQLQADETDAAIANLRVALDTAPEDIQAMNLMYEAYTRAGDTALARDFLALAVDASGNAPETSLRYARVLIQEERFLPAEDVLLPALRLAPNNPDLLGLLGQLYLRMEDIARATQVVDTLRRLDTEQSVALANGLQAEILNQESGTEEALQFLETLATGEDADLRAKLILLQARMSVGETAEALQLAQELASENPDNLGLKQALANTQAAAGDLDAAKATLREVTSAAPEAAVDAWLQMARIATRQGNDTEADAVIEEALAATNNNVNILWAKASALEKNGDIEGAIGIYEGLYAENSGSIIVANNLASLLTTYREDPESLERAWVIARRLRDTEVPAFQDTYGWIAYLRGDHETALEYLSAAAEALPEEPTVQYHLGMTYLALERTEEARAALERTLALAGDSPLPEATRAREALQGL
jgi:Flp pilus assembly protein TadD